MKRSLRKIREHFAEPLYAQSYFLMAGTAATASSGFFFWLIAARRYDTGVVGRAVGLIASISLLNFITNLGLPYGLLRFVGNQDDPAPTIVSSFMLSAVSSLVAGLVFVAGASIWTPEISSLLDSGFEVVLFVAFGIFVALGLLLDQVFAAKRLGGWSLIRALISSIGKLALVLLLVSEGARGIYWAMFLPITVATTTLLVLLPRILGQSLTWRPSLSGGAGEAFRFSIRNYPSSLNR